MKPRLLDLFCGAGGAGMGYAQAGFEVVGVDIAPQPSYPFDFVQADALEYLAAHGEEFDVIHASPPCQAHTRLRALVEARYGERGYVDLIAATRRALQATGRLYVIENVPGAPLRRPILLCGEMFGLKVFRHRLFELGPNVFLLAPPHPRHPRWATTNAHRGVSGFRHGATHICATGGNFVLDDARVAMGVPWMRTRREVSQAVPPAYTRWIGEQLLAFYGDRMRGKARQHRDFSELSRPAASGTVSGPLTRR